ncbi:MAG: hypothetical protein U0790_16690 [Isosphaeraceae bacterium]
MRKRESGIRARLLAEMSTILGIFLYLAAFLGAFTQYRRLVLGEYQISYLHYGYNLVEAFILAKVIVLGSALGVGERFRDRPLIVSTLYKTAAFSLLVLAFSIGEHLLTAWFHGETTRAAWDAMLGQGAGEILSRVLVIILAFLPMFAVWEIDRVLGDGKLFDLFFTRGAGASPEGRTVLPAADPDTAS